MAQSLASRQTIRGSTVPGWLSYLNGRQPGETPHALDDFFTAPTLDAAWSTVTITGSLAATVGQGRLSLKASGGAAADFQGILKSIGGASSPLTLEIAANFLGDNQVGAGMVGVCFTDGTAASSNIFGIRIFGANDTVSTVEGTLTSVDSTSSNVIVRGAYTGFNGRIYMRAGWTASNTFTAKLSIDGVTWSPFVLGSPSKTMTPTHVGIFALDWSSTSDSLATVDYFRAYESTP